MMDHINEVADELWQRWTCKTHSKGPLSLVYCYSPPNGGGICYPLTHYNIRQWALEIVYIFCLPPYKVITNYTWYWALEIRGCNNWQEAAFVGFPQCKRAFTFDLCPSQEPTDGESTFSTPIQLSHSHHFHAANGSSRKPRTYRPTIWDRRRNVKWSYSSTSKQSNRSVSHVPTTTLVFRRFTAVLHI